VATTGSFVAGASPPPTVKSFTPAAATGLARVTISGTGLGGATEVAFGGTASPAIVSDTATQIVAQVPVDAVNGPIAVTTPVGASAPSSATFKPLAKVTGFAGDPAQIGDTVTVSGYDFTANTSAPLVKLGSGVLTPSAFGATSLSVTVPDGAVTAALSVANGNGTATSPTRLHVRPRIDSLSVDHGITRTSVTLTGATFTGTSVVTVGGVGASFSVVDYHHLRVTIPAAALTGPIAVKNAGGTTSSPTFTVEPRITSFTPLGGKPGTTVVVNGTGFGLGSDARTVTVGGTPAASVTYVSRTRLKLVVPAGGASGPIAVAVNGGTQGISVRPFNVT
jgi:hypothetical protein